jgi:ligand-binding sensor domain-containing protein/serine phosphatase RsbU (regulator of sigma subunit)
MPIVARAHAIRALGTALLAAVCATTWARTARALDPAKSPEQYVAKVWRQSDDGLPQNFVASIAQTQDGYLWMATQEGLVRFDGARFVVLTTRDVPELETNDVDALLADRAGGLWIATRGGGLTRYVNGAWRTFRATDGLAHDVVLSLLEARDGSIWIGTRGGGISRWSKGRFTNYDEKDGLPSRIVWALAEARDGSILAGTDAGLARWDGGRFASFTAGLSDPSVRALLADPDGGVWLGTRHGLDRWQGGAIERLSTLEGLDDAIYALTRDRDGNVWIGGDTGLRRVSRAEHAPGTPTPIGTVTSLAGDELHRYERVRALREDTEGNLWVGMEARGLLRLQDGKVTTFGSSMLWSVFEDAQGALWLGGGSDLFAVRGDTFASVDDPGHLASHGILSMTNARDGGLFIGTDSGGLLSLQGGRLARAPGQAALDVVIRAVLTDSRGALWVGFNDGLARLADGVFTRFGATDGVPPVAVNAIVEGPPGTLWFGMDSGVLRFADGKFTLRDARGGASDAPVQALFVDGDEMWAGTYGAGLELLHDGDRVGRVTTKNGLFNDVAYAIVDDGLGELWITCNQGIFHAKRSDLLAVARGQRESLVSPSLGISDGMRSSECNSGVPGGVRARDGRLWFPTSAGAVRVDPRHMRKNGVVPPVRIEEMQVNRARVARDGAHVLAPDSKDFAFAYTALSFTAPERVAFKYMLDGFDKDWVDAGSRRVAYYTNLAPGRYRFRVVAANDDGVWNDEGASVDFTLEPHLWQTTWFYAACALGLMFAGAGTVRLRLHGLRVRARELEKKVDERTQQLARANDELQGAFKALAEKDARLHEDLLQAQAFQQRILPKLPSGGPLRIRALYRPADLVGGDVYDVCEVADGHYRVFVADTTGHGVQASLRTMVLKTEYDRLKLASEGPAHVLADLNRKIATVYPGLEMRCSACCVDVIADANGGARVRYANAAHPPLLRVTRGRVEEVYAPGTFLGIVSDAVFVEKQVYLEDGDLLVAYTDGVCEQEDAGGRAFGVERMEELLAKEGRDANAAIEALDGAVTTYAAGRPLDDDVAIVCIECAADRTSRILLGDLDALKKGVAR